MWQQTKVQLKREGGEERDKEINRQDYIQTIRQNTVLQTDRKTYRQSGSKMCYRQTDMQTNRQRDDEDAKKVN